MKAKKTIFIISIIIILVGIGLVVCSLVNIRKSVKLEEKSIVEWEQKKQNYVSDSKDEIPYYSKPKSGEIIGKLVVSNLQKEIPVFEGTTDEILDMGAGHYESTVFPGDFGNSVLFGHRDTVFRCLKDVKKGDRMVMETTYEKLTFEVNTIEITEPNDSCILEESDEPILTLVTCYPFYYVGAAPKRCVIKLNLLSREDNSVKY